MKSPKKSRLAIIGTVGVPANYGGFETLTEQLIDDLSQSYDLRVYCSSKAYAKEQRKKSYKGAKLTYIPLEANGIQSIIYDSISIIHSLFVADVLLVLGVAGAWILPFVKLFTRKKIIISIDGIEWKRDKWNILAKWYLFWAEGIAVRYSHIDISDNESIQDYTAARYGTLSRIIEYGADHTLEVALTAENTMNYDFLRAPYAFKVCRIEPENNVHMVLQAFAETSNLPLVIVGNWDKSEYGRQLKQKYREHSNIYVLDPIYDQQKLDLLRSNASLYVHGHSAGGTNPSLVEAMYLKLPVIAYGVSYNRVTTGHKAFYFDRLDDLKKLIQTLTPDQLLQNRKHMGEMAHIRYTWRHITNRYKQLVEEAITTEKKQAVIPEAFEVEYEQLLELGHAHLKSVYKF
jgi:glycosyltransferase involved in cell wall biosynthesis